MNMLPIILTQLFILYAFLVFGFGFGKWKKNLESQTGILSVLLVNLFLPSKVFLTFSKNFTVEYLSQKYPLILASLCMVILLHFLSLFLARVLHRDEFVRRILEYTFVSSNYGYLGYVLYEGIYGAEALTDMIAFCIPFSFYTYTVGFLRLTGSGFSWKRTANPLTGSLVLGMLFGLLQIPIPSVLQSIFASSSACMGPISMLLTGVVLSALPLKECLRDKLSYLVVGIRLVAIPAIVFFTFKLLGLSELLPCALFVAAMPTGLNTIVFPKSAGLDPIPGARLAVISNLASVVTIPFWLSLL